MTKTEMQSTIEDLDSTVATRDRMLNELRAANKAAVDRAVELTTKNEALEAECLTLRRKLERAERERTEFRTRWENAHARVPT